MNKLLLFIKNKKLLLFGLLFMFVLQLNAHVTEIRVNQNQDGSLTWYLQTYHRRGQCGISNSGININGVNYPIQAEYSGSTVNLSSTVFAAYNSSLTNNRQSYAVVQTPYIPGVLNVNPYSTNVCWAFLVGGNGSFTPPPPPVCTSFPVTGASNSLGTPNNGGTTCDSSDDTIPVNLNVNHLACGNITGDGEFAVYLDPNGANTFLGNVTYQNGITTPFSFILPTNVEATVKFTDNDFPSNSFNYNITGLGGNQFTGVGDTTPPNVIVKNITINLDNNGQAIISAADIDNGSNDECGIESFSLNTSIFNCSNIGTNQVTLTATDINGNTSSANASVTVEDVSAPTVITKNITVELDENGNINITPEMINNGSFDNCGIVSLSTDLTSFSCENIGENTVNLFATDASGNSNSGPSIPEGLIGHWKFNDGNELKDLTGNWGDLIVSGNASISNGELDVNNGGMARTSSYSGGTIRNKTLISYVSLDNLNQRSGSAITLDAINVDQFDGIIYAEQQANRWMNGSSYFRRTQPLNPGFAESVVNEKVMVAITYEQVNTNQVKISFYRNGIGYGSYISNNFRTWNPGNSEILFGARHYIGTTQIGALDAHIDEAMIFNRSLTFDEIAALSGNYESGTPATVTVIDNIAPKFLTTESAFIILDENGVATYDTESFNRDTVTDNCAIDRLEFDKTVFNCDEIGFHTINVTAFDVNGNSTVGQINLEVREEIFPTVITKDIEVVLDADGKASIVPEDVNDGTFDNCSFTISLDTTEFTCANVGNNVVNLTATDSHGLTSTSQANVLIIDNTPPTVLTQDISIDLDTSGNASITTSLIDNGSSDACGIKSYMLNISSFNCSNVGVNEVVLTVTDNNGNTSTETANVTVNDVTAPIVVTQDISINLDANGSAIITPDMIDNNSTDSCGIESYTLDIDSFSCSNVGLNEVILTVTDNNGNSASSNATVTVSDITPPTVITQSYSIDLANGVANITASDIDGGTFDNCDFTLSIDKTDFTCDDIGDHTVTLTATDASGNTSSNTATVSIVGDIPNIEIQDFYAVNTQKVNTIFLGYGPQSINLNSITTGGSGFTYEWTSNSGEIVSNEANPSISPQVSTTYDVTVTNSNGCTATTSIYVCVIDARAYDKKGRYKGKVVVCHHTNGKKGTKHVVINISQNAVMTHLTQHGVGTDHADTLGAFDAVCVGSTSARSTKKENVTTASIIDNLLIYPNPSNGIFDIRLTAVNLDTDILLFDSTGKLIERKSISKEISSENIITIGNNNLANGFYLLRIITKNETVTKKLIISKE